MAQDDINIEDIGVSYGEGGSSSYYPREAGVISIGNGKKTVDYAWGLIWSFADDGDTIKKTKKYAIEQASSNHADLYCIPNKGFYGLGSSDAGHKKGMKPLATVIKDAGGMTSSDALMAFMIPGVGTYVLALDAEGHIISDTDTLFTDEVAARDFFHNHYTLAEWKTTSAPHSWNIRGAKNESLDVIINSSRSSCKLSEVSNAGSYKKFAMLAGVAAVLGGVYYAWGAWQAHELAVQQEHSRQEAIKRTNHLKEMARKRIAEQPWPYDNQIKGVAGLIMCESAILETPIILPGYEVQNLTCNPSPGTVIVVYKQKDPLASYAQVPQYINATTDINPKPHIAHSKDTVTVGYNYSAMFSNSKNRYGRHEQGGNVNDVWNYLDGYLSTIRQKLSFDVKMYEPAPTPQGKKKDEISASQMVFRNFHFVIKSIYPPGDYKEILAPIKILVASSVSYDYTKRLWSFAGDSFQPVLQSDIDKQSASVRKK